MINITPFKVENIRIKIIKNFSDPLYKNSYILIVNTVLAAMFGFIFWTATAKVYSTNDVGLAVTMISAISLLAIFSNLGFSSSLIRYLPNSDGETYKNIINTCFTISGAISLILTVAFLAVLNIVSPALMFIRANWWFSLAFILFSIAMSLNTLQVSIFIGKRSTQFELIKNLMWNILKIVLIFYFTWLGAFGVFSSFGIALVIAFTFGTVILLRKIHPEYLPIPTIDKKVVKDLFNYSSKNYIADFLITAPGFLLPLMITNILSPEDSAYFFMAWMITGLILIIPIAISNSLFAEGSYDEEKIYAYLKKSLYLAFILVIPTTFIILTVGNKILLMFGKEYSENATHILWLLALSCIPYTFNRMYITLKKIKHDINTVIAINGATAIIGLGSAYLLLNQIGLIGVGVGWVLGQGIVMVGILYMLYIQKYKLFNR